MRGPLIFRSHGVFKSQYRFNQKSGLTKEYELPKMSTFSIVSVSCELLSILCENSSTNSGLLEVALLAFIWVNIYHVVYTWAAQSWCI